MSRRVGKGEVPYFARVCKLCDEIDATTLPPLHRLVMVMLAEYANPDGSNIFPEQETIAKRCGLSRRALCYILAELEKAGWVVRERRRWDGKQTSTVYRVRLGGIAIVRRERPGNVAWVDPGEKRAPIKH